MDTTKVKTIVKRYECPRCGYLTNKDGILTHLHRFTKCESIYSNVNIHDNAVREKILKGIDYNVLGKNLKERAIFKTNKAPDKEYDNFMYIIHEREFVNSKEPIYKIGFTTTFYIRATQYPKGSKLMFLMPVIGFPETECLQAFRSTFLARTDIGDEYFEGDIHSMISILFKCIQTTNFPKSTT